MSKLFQPYDLAGLQLPNRIVMAPMTRSRARDLNPDHLTALYYAQRASAGLIISEGIPITPEARGYAFTPGIYTSSQVAGWRRVTDAVHEKGGRIFAQLWHVGRISHHSLQDDGGAPVSSTSTRAATATSYAFDENGNDRQLPCSPPRQLTQDDIRRVEDDFVQATLNAVEAGFDGVELHGANGYLFEQFISGSVNDRTDHYGGSIENRLRFPLEMIDAASNAIGSNRVALRISPFGRLNAIAAYETETKTWLTLAAELSARGLAYLHLSDQHTIGGTGIPGEFVSSLRRNYKGTLMAAGGFDRASGEAALAADRLDLIAFGRPFITNPDLVQRLANGWPVEGHDRSSFYGGIGEEGYVDFPTYSAADAQHI